MSNETSEYNSQQSDGDKAICDGLADVIDSNLTDAENKIWHRHPVWFLAGNPIVGYSKLKAGIRLMFWGGASFDEEKLKPGTGKFKDASIVYNSVDQIDIDSVTRWLEKSRSIQWDCKYIMKRRGRLERLV